MKSRSSGYSSDSEQQNMQQDLSVLRKPICTALSGFLEAKRAYENGTEEIKRLLSRECDVIYECNICRNMFRSLTNFISHKRVYCRNSFNTLSHNLNPNRNGYIDHDISTIIQTEENNGNKSTNTNKDNLNKNSEGSTKDLSSIVEKLLKREQENRVLKLTDLYDQVNFQLKQDEILRKKHVLQLDKVPNSNAAVYQTIKNNENDNIKNEINEVAQLLENNKNIIGPDGKLITENQNGISNGTSITSNTKDCTNNIIDNDTNNISGEFSCNLCYKKYSTEKTLRLHIQRNHIASTYVYQCPSCLLPFSQPGAVIRHLSNDHKKSTRRIRSMREAIFKRKVRISDVQKKAPSKELARLQSKIDNGDIANITNGGESQLWNKNNEWPNINTPTCTYCGKTFERKAVLTTHLTNCPMKSRTTTQSATSVSTANITTRKSNEIRNIQKILENGNTTTVVSNDNETNIKKTQDKKSILGHSIFIDSIDLTNDDCAVPSTVVVSKRKRKKTLKISKESDSNDIDSEKLNEMFLKLGCSDNSITLKSMPFDSNSSNNSKKDKCNDNAFITPITIDEDEQPKDNIRKIYNKTDRKELLNRHEKKSEIKLELLDGALNRKSISNTLREDLEKLENSKEITITQLEKQLTTSTKISKDSQKLQQRLQQQQEQEQQKQLQKQQKEQLKQQREQQKQQQREQQKQQQEQQKQQQEPQKQKREQQQEQQQQSEKSCDVDEPMIQANESNMNPKQNVSFLCRICEKQFDVISNVRRHISMFHYRSRKFSCKVCHEYKAYRKFDVLNHLSTIHSMDEEKEVAMKFVEISGNKNKIEGIEDDIVVVENKLSFNSDISMEISVPSEQRNKKRVRRQKLSKDNNTTEKNSDELKDEQSLPQQEQEKLPIKLKFTRSSLNNLLSSSNDESTLSIAPPSSKRPIRNRIKPVHKDFVYDLSHILKKDMISENIPARANKRRNTITTNGDINNRDELIPNKIINGTVQQQLQQQLQQQQQPQQQQQQQQQKQQQLDLKIKGSAEKMAKLAVASFQASYCQMPDFPERQFFPLRVFSPLIAPNFDFSTPKINSNEKIIKESLSDKIIEDIIPKHRRMSDDNIVHILSKRKRLNSTLGKSTKSTSSSHIDKDLNFFNENDNSSIKCPTEKEFKEHLLLNKLSEPVKKVPVTSFVEPKTISSPSLSSSSSSSTPSKRITLLQRLAENQHKKIQESLLRSVLEK